MNSFGKEINRVDGPLKVRGEAKYAGEFTAEGLLYGVVVSSSIARGKIVSFDLSEAESFPGVVKILTHENRPEVSRSNDDFKDDDSPRGKHFRALFDNEVIYNGQPIALVVAKDFETARAAAGAVKVNYQKGPEPRTDLRKERQEAMVPTKERFTPPPKPKGNSARAWEEAPFKISSEYICPPEHHNPMEPHVSTVMYDNGKLTIYDKTQGVLNSHDYVCRAFGLPLKNVRVLSPFVGGGFGSGLRPQYQLYLAVMAAMDLKASVRVTLTRQQMFTFGHRPNTIQELRLACDKSGKLTSIEHRAVSETSTFENYTENIVDWVTMLYPSPNTLQEYKIARLDVYTPTDMRAPGAAWGVNIVEMAMDELAHEADIDPLQFRLINYGERDQAEDKPFSSKELRKCYEEGARAFGWGERNPKPRSMKRNGKLIGHGMATGVWHALYVKASARVVLTSDGKAHVSSATSDIGTGTYTAMTQVAADSLGIDIKNVVFTLGDSDLPKAPLEGGSWTAASVGSAIQEACFKMLKEIEKLDPNYKKKNLSIIDVLKKAGKEKIEVEITNEPDKKISEKYSMLTHSAYFVEVEVDEDVGTVKINRVVTAVAAGKIINPKTARSQVMGGVVWGIGMAMHEESLMDHNFGKYINNNFADYHIPVNKDIYDIDVIFVKEDDDKVNPLGVKGLGEIGIVGAAAAVGNAIFHATGVRVREYPITMDKILCL